MNERLIPTSNADFSPQKGELIIPKSEMFRFANSVRLQMQGVKTGSLGQSNFMQEQIQIAREEADETLRLAKKAALMGLLPDADSVGRFYAGEIAKPAYYSTLNVDDKRLVSALPELVERHMALLRDGGGMDGSRAVLVQNLDVYAQEMDAQPVDDIDRHTAQTIVAGYRAGLTFSDIR